MGNFANRSWRFIQRLERWGLLRDSGRECRLKRAMRSQTPTYDSAVSTAGWTGLREAHMLDDLHEFRALAKRIEARILGKSEELHVPLPAGPVEPFHCLVGFVQRDVGRGNIVGRHT